MANQKVDFSNMANIISSYLDEYGLQVKETLQEASKKTGQEVAKELRKGGSYQTNKTGEKFNKGWKATEQKSRLGISTVVHNTTIPGLAHLLEFGHAKRNGGRTRAFNFIAPVADTVEKKFVDAFEKALDKG